MSDIIVGSKIGGNLKNLLFDDGTSKLKYKSNGSVVEIAGGSTIKMLQMVRPISDESLFPVVEACADENFTSGSTTIYNAYSDSTCRSKFMAYSSGWVAFPTNGLGTPFDNQVVICDLTAITYDEPYFIRWRWITSDGTEGDWTSSKFPSSPGFVGNIGTSTAQDESFTNLVYASTIALTPDNGKNQKIDLSGDCAITSPVLTSADPLLLLEVTLNGHTLTIGGSTVTSATGVVQVGWYYNGASIRRLPSIDVVIGG